MANATHNFEFMVNGVDVEGTFWATFSQDTEYGPDGIGSRTDTYVDCEKEEVTATYINDVEVDFDSLPQTTKDVIEARMESLFDELDTDEFDPIIEDDRDVECSW